MAIRTILSLLSPLLLLTPTAGADDLTVLFLGDNGHHQPRVRFAELAPVLKQRGIQLVYSDEPRDLNAGVLASYDAVALYANIDRIEKDQADALLAYVASGHGFVPIHCATFCFRNDERIVALMGAQFQRHTTGTFRTEITEPDHPVMRGFGGFESWDETYVHHKHNTENRTVLSVRVDDQGREPWTWVRTHGKGRVFYTAWGHDHRTWNNPGFQNLIERGLRWAAGAEPAEAGEYLADRPFPVPRMTPPRTDVAPFKYVDVGPKIPNYRPGRQGQAHTTMQQPLAPEESLKHFVVPEGFRVELFAAEPDFEGKPICMAWDERGRLWVCETYDYPNELQPRGEGRDRIRICEDTDGDWKADKFTVFAEQLSIPTALTFHRGGVIVQNGTETLFLRDTTGDDVADERRVLFSNWALGDTHGGVSNFQYGPDNWIWAMQGYNNSSPEVDGQQSQSFRMGFFRFRPDGSRIEFIRSTNNNTWGLGISEEGLIFGSTANGNPSVFMPIPNRYYERVRGWAPSLVLSSIADTHKFQPVTTNVRQVDWHDGYTAGAGHALYTARRYPPEYWNRVAFVNGPTGHLVGTFVLKEQGAGFRSHSPFNLIASDDEWSAPIMSEVGPDGNVWMLDWYNYIVQHNPTPRGFETGRGNAYKSDLRDKKHGRIYRIVYGSDREPFSLAGADEQRLVAALTHANMLWRRHAQRLLVERGELDVCEQLYALISNSDVDAAGQNVGATHAIWTLDGLNALAASSPECQRAAQILVSAAKHKSPAVRRAAVQALAGQKHSAGVPAAAGLLGDSNAQVRLAALLALADLPPTDDAAAAVHSALAAPRNLSDPWISHAITAAAARNDVAFLKAAAALQTPSPQVIGIIGIVAEHYARGKASDSIAALLAGLKHADPTVAGTILDGVSRGWPADAPVRLDESSEKDLETLLTRLPPSSRGRLVKLASGWGSERFRRYAAEVSRDLLVAIDNPDTTDKDREAAARQLIEFRPNDASAVQQLLDRVTPQTSGALAGQLLAAVGRSRSLEAGPLIIEKLTRMTPATRRAGITALLGRTENTKALLKSLQSGQLRTGDLSLDQRQALTSHPDREIRRLATRVLKESGGLPSPDRRKVLAELMPLTKLTGDADRGREVFKKQCAKCHLHSGEGERIGPDLTGMVVHPKSELLTHIIDPSASVEGNYRLYSVITQDGRAVNGMLASESRTALELYDSEGRKHTVLREDIDELVASGKSLMPEGFEKLASREEITDLLEFLTHRGRFVPIDLARAATITSARGMFVNKAANVERLIFPDWKPKVFQDVPFQLVDPRDGEVANVIMLHAPRTDITRRMPRSVSVPCHGSARTIHLLSGVGGWAYPYSQEKTVSMIVRLHYADGQAEDHELRNGVHFADYIRHEDVPESVLAFRLRGQQIRYLAVHPRRSVALAQIEFVKGPDQTAPVVMAVTVEAP